MNSQIAVIHTLSPFTLEARDDANKLHLVQKAWQ
jgi:hypothetical protein